MKKFRETTRHIGRFLGVIAGIAAFILTLYFFPLLAVFLVFGGGTLALLYALWIITEPR